MDSPFYVCIKCHLILHPLCYDIPREIRHPVHQIDHCLPLLPVVEGISNNCCCICRSFFCDVFPGNSWSTEMKNSAFQCRKCRVYVCVPCALSVPTKRIQLFGHPHPLFIMENRRNHMLRCRLCRVKSKDDILISCFECKHIFHLSCGQDLATEIPLHPYHPLPKHPLQLLHESTKSSSSRYEICPGCDEPIDAFHYRCRECGFAIDAYCAKQVPRSIKSETHEHPLSCFNENINANKCSDCGQVCSPPYFRCVTCGHNLHVRCFPNLPLKVKNEHHGHFLTLTKHQVKDHPEDVDETEFYCTSCERPRYLHDPTYSCDECHNFVSHFQCVNLEIFRVWEEDGTLASIIDQKTDTSSNVLEEVENEVNITFEIGEVSSSNTSFVGQDQYINAPHKELEELETNIADLQREEMALKTEFEILCKKRETLAAQLEEARAKSTHLGRH
ncbi:uncharacterized protein LOC127786619 [Diospyros lotus]|uniref:uncharacterized protein LOC127786619 n=1 Tax=Diospyros lotus TaxID=55363 RepID=UPI00224CFA5A|nr:uncharacterized protein LOC127786619 [Diospyros lotus]